MKYSKDIILLFCTIAIVGCSSIYQIKSYDGPEILEHTNFCELNKIESGKFISTIAYYTGIEEYWGLTSNTKCSLDHKVYLDIEEIFQTQLNKKLDREFEKLYKNYWKYSLKLRIAGKLERTKEELGYGHLGLKKVQIIPYQIEIIGKHKIDIED